VGEYLHTERKSTSGDYSEKIEAITAGVVEMKTLDERWDGAVYYMQAEMTIDPAEVNRRIAEVLNDKQRTQDLEEARLRTRALELEVKRLQTALAEQKRVAETGNGQTGKTPAEATTALQTAYAQQMAQLSIEEYFIEGEYAFEKKDYDTAIDYYLKAVEIDPKNVTAYYKMAYAYEQKTYRNLAEKYYRKVLKLDPNNFAALYAMQDRYYSSNKKYFSYSRKLISLDPNNITLLKKIVTDFSINNIKCDQDAFSEYFFTVLVYFPFLPVVIVKRINSKAYAQQLLKWYEEIINIDPNYTDYAYQKMKEIYSMKYFRKKHRLNFYRKFAQQGNKDAQKWFRDQGISWIE
jgi:superkiller protein 3